MTLDLDALLTLDAEVRASKTEIERLRAERNAISAQFPTAAPEEKAELLWRFYELQQGARARMILVLVLTIVFLLCLVGIGGYLIYTHQLPFLTAMARPR